MLVDGDDVGDGVGDDQFLIKLMSYDVYETITARSEETVPSNKKNTSNFNK